MKKFLSRAVGTAGAAAAGWIAYSRYLVNHSRTLPPALDADRENFTSPRAGTLSYYLDTDRQGTPLVLVHSINAAASAYEVKPLFDRYREQRPVYALDLPGFGFSRRADRDYSPRLYTEAIMDFVERVLPDGPADVVALSLASEFCARAALARPDRFRSLAMISPTGFDSREHGGGSETALRGLSFPLWSQAFYDLLVSPLSIRYFLSKSFDGAVDRDLARYDYAASHRPGARFAPLYFLSGKLFTPRVREAIYAYLTVPVEVLYDRDAYVSFESLPDFVQQHPRWHAVCVAGTRGLPHFEKPRETCRALDMFWRSAPMPV